MRMVTPNIGKLSKSRKQIYRTYTHSNREVFRTLTSFNIAILNMKYKEDINKTEIVNVFITYPKIKLKENKGSEKGNNIIAKKSIFIKVFFFI